MSTREQNFDEVLSSAVSQPPKKKVLTREKTSKIISAGMMTQIKTKWRHKLLVFLQYILRLSLLNNLRDELVWNRREELGLVVDCADGVGADRLLWVSLAVGLLAGRLRLLLLGLVALDAVEEVLTALRVLHVLHTHGHPLCQDLATHALVDQDPDGVLGDVEHAP